MSKQTRNLVDGRTASTNFVSLPIHTHYDPVFSSLAFSIQAFSAAPCGLPRLRAPGIVSLRYLFLQATPSFPHGVTTVG